MIFQVAAYMFCTFPARYTILILHGRRARGCRTGFYQFFDAFNLRTYHTSSETFQSTCEVADDVVEWNHWM